MRGGGEPAGKSRPMLPGLLQLAPFAFVIDLADGRFDERRHCKVSRYSSRGSNSSGFTLIVAIWFPGLMFCGSTIQPPKLPLVFGSVPAAIVNRLARCVRSGATCPLAMVPLMLWQ